MRNKPDLSRLAIGLGLVFGLWLAGIALPLYEGYRSIGPWLKDHTCAPAQRFDRAALRHDLAAAGFSLGDAAFVRIYKRESRLELWVRGRSGRFELFRAYTICTFSGRPGPKLKEGDRQSPEGFYAVTASQLNPASRHHLAFNIGFPNEYDRALGRTGSALMVHGGCSSIGCYAMTDKKVDEIYAVMEAALGAGQRAVAVHIFPFVPTGAALAAVRGHPSVAFWRNLKQGHDLFEETHMPPLVAACGGAYRFGADARAPGCQPIRGWGA